MPFYRIGDTMMHVKFGGKVAKNPPAPCCAARIECVATTHHPEQQSSRIRARCMAMSAFLCDWPVDGGTCDAPLCDEHATEVGHDRHYCLLHASTAREREPELF